MRIDHPDERPEFVDIDGEVVLIAVGGAELQAVNQI
jgi:hypothetical protein